VRGVCGALRAAFDASNPNLTIRVHRDDDEGASSPAPSPERLLHLVLGSPALRELCISASCSNAAELLRAAAARVQPLPRLQLQLFSGEVAERQVQHMCETLRDIVARGTICSKLAVLELEGFGSNWADNAVAAYGDADQLRSVLASLPAPALRKLCLTPARQMRAASLARMAPGIGALTGLHELEIGTCERLAPAAMPALDTRNARLFAGLTALGQLGQLQRLSLSLRMFGHDSTVILARLLSGPLAA